MSKCLVFFVFLFLRFSADAQVRVSGTVTGSDGQALSGVHVTALDSPIGTATDADGKYVLENLSENATLHFSFIGYTTVEKRLGSSSIINVTMTEDVTKLNEVMVLGYKTTSKARLVGSAVQLDSKSLSQTPYVSADQALQGKVAGLVLVTPSGAPGSGMQIRIRGISSITAGNDPLFVIDGVPVNSGDAQYSLTSLTLNPLSSIDPENIESITVLKDASSTALYGARGANGVIVVKTKRGKAGKTQFNFTTSYGLNNNATPGPPVLTADQRAELFYESIYNAYGVKNGFAKDQAKEYYLKNVAKSDDQYAKWEQDGRPNTDWGDVITHKNAKFKQFNLSASGGGNGGNFFTSLGYTKQEATIIGADFERLSGQINLDKDFSKKLHFSTQNSGAYTRQNGFLEQSAYYSSPRTIKFFMPPTVTPYNPDGSINLDTTYPNPLYLAANNINQSKLIRILTNNSLSYDLPIKNLRFTTRAALDWQASHYKSFSNKNYGDGLSKSGLNSTAFTSNLNYVIQNYFDYEVEVHKNHSFTFKVMQEFQRNNFYNLVASGNSFSTDGLNNLANAGTPTTASSSNTNWLLASYSGLMEYAAFDNRYVLNASIRKEGSSRFSPENRWGAFWSVGLAWNIYKEGFLENVSSISNLKLRSSYGKTGNANISLNQYQSLLDFTAAYGGKAASLPSTYGNKNLSWETSYPFEAGADVGLFDDRITGRFTYFYRKTKDLLQTVPITKTSGFSSQIQNTGSLSNEGIEVEANFELVRKKDFHLSLGGNLATAKNKVLTLGKSASGQTLTIQNGDQKTDIGHPTNGWFLPNWAGVDPQTGEDTWYGGEGASTITTNYNKAAQSKFWQGGSAIPTLTAGMNLHVDYKGIFLDANGYYAGGNKVLENWVSSTLGNNLQSLYTGNGMQALMDRWQKPGDIARFPKMQYDNGSEAPTSSKFLYLGDFFRVKSLTLGYNIAPVILKKLAITGVQIFIRASNFFTWVKDSRLTYDPEMSLVGYSTMTTPPYQSIMTGLTIKF